MPSQFKTPLPPSIMTGEMGVWADTVWQAINNQPTLSVFSGTHPNSSVTGVAGNIAVNVAPSSSVSRLFIKYGSAVIPDMNSWVTIA